MAENPCVSLHYPAGERRVQTKKENKQFIKVQNTFLSCCCTESSVRTLTNTRISPRVGLYGVFSSLSLFLLKMKLRVNLVFFAEQTYRSYLT